MTYGNEWNDWGQKSGDWGQKSDWGQKKDTAPAPRRYIYIDYCHMVHFVFFALGMCVGGIRLSPVSLLHRLTSLLPNNIKVP